MVLNFFSSNDQEELILVQFNLLFLRSPNQKKSLSFIV